MSWSAYTDKLVNDSPADMAAFVSLENKAIWAQTGVTMTADEAAKLVALVNGDAAAQGAAAASGVFIGGEKYMFVNVLDNTVNLKKGTGGAVIVKSKQLAILLAYKPNDKAISNSQILTYASKCAATMASKGY